jgi:hypothetical protein
MQIYFFNSAVSELYQNDIIPIAEGLKELGYTFTARHDYWREEAGADFLFKSSPEVVPEECDLVVASYMLFGVSVTSQAAEQKKFLTLLRRRSAKTKVAFIDDSDGYAVPSWRPEFQHCDLICRTKYNTRAYAPANTIPWAIGLTNRTLRAASSVSEPPGRMRAIYVNYGASHPFEHTTRLKAKTLLHPALAPVLETYQPEFADLSSPPKDPYDRLMWEQTSKRHSRMYFERMKSCLVSSAFCGDEIPAAPWNPAGYCVGGGKARLRRRFFNVVQKFDPRSPRVISSDSFRFWESMACSTVPMQVDFEHYGLKMPVQPEPYIHYLPVRFDDLDKSVSLIKTQLNSLESVGDEARGWAMANYCPRVVAQRFLCASDEARSRLFS